MAKIVLTISIYENNYKENLNFYAKHEEVILITRNVKVMDTDDQVVDTMYGQENE